MWLSFSIFAQRKSFLIILVQFSMLIAQLFVAENNVKLIFMIMMIISIFHFKPEYILASVFIIASFWHIYICTKIHPLKLLSTKVSNMFSDKHKNKNEHDKILIDENIKAKEKLKEKMYQENDKQDKKNSSNAFINEKKLKLDFYNDNTATVNENNIRRTSEHPHCQKIENYGVYKHKLNQEINNNQEIYRLKGGDREYCRENSIYEKGTRCFNQSNYLKPINSYKEDKITENLSDRSFKSEPITYVKREKITRRCNSNIKNRKKQRYSTEMVKNKEEKRRKRIKAGPNTTKFVRLKYKEGKKYSSQNELMNEKEEKYNMNKKMSVSTTQIESFCSEDVYSRANFNVYGFSFKINNISDVQNIFKEYHSKKDKETQIKFLETICSLFKKNKDFSEFNGDFHELIEIINNKANEEQGEGVKAKYILIIDRQNKYFITDFNKINEGSGLLMQEYDEIEKTDDIKRIAFIMLTQKNRNICDNEIKIIFFVN